MHRVWTFLRKRTNREIVSWIGSGLAVLATGAWALFTYVAGEQKVPAAPSATSVTINQSGPGIASGRDTVVHGPVNIGLDEKAVGKEVAAAQKPLADDIKDIKRLVDQISQGKGVPSAPLREILTKLKEAGVSDEDIPKRLDEKADELIKLREEIARLRQGPPELAAFAQQAQELIDKGDLDGARAVLAKGRQAARNLREQAEKFEADFLAQEANVDHLQLAYRKAAEKYAEAARLLTGADHEQQWGYLRRQGRELYAQGDEFGDNAALTEAIDVYRAALSLMPRSRDALNWALTQHHLANALVALGERKEGTAHLEEAVAAYREALKERTRARVPLAWAATQVSLGSALRALGARESGTATLEQAVAVYRSAVEIYTRTNAPQEWAAAQTNLGNALRLLGARKSSTVDLKEAATAHREALLVYTRERAPLYWATSQNNLGNALYTLGSQEGGAAHFEEAVAAYRAALQERTRTRVPLQWATTQNNLGAALYMAVERGGGTAQLEEAIAAVGEALKERRRDRVPLDWAASTGLQGVAMALLAERKRDASLAERAVGQIEQAFAVTRDGGHQPNAKYFEGQLADARGIRDRLRAR